MAPSSACPSAASSPSWKYDVFLSFRGEDTRRNFTDHLHSELKRFGINTFIDDQLRRGEQISPTLLQAIEESRFSIIIFSQNYAFSGWCLDEITKILERVHKGKHTAFPVFYEVDPSDVRKQRGSYEEAFKKHEEAYKNNMEKVLEWRKVLTEASGYAGWDTRDRHQSEVIKEIVFKIFNEILENQSSSNIEPMIGMDSRIKDLLSLLCLESPAVRMVGIWGMAGIGKTTIAKAIYQRICTQFQGCCFLSNVREKSQRNEDIKTELLSEILREKSLDPRICNRDNSIEKLLHSMAVLIILDDVNHIKQLNELAGHQNWFGSKSRIIITTRDKRLLEEQEVDEVYKAEELQKEEAHTLFCQYAFKHKPLKKDFKELCGRFLDYTKGNPLALKILGSFLYKRRKEEWESELKKLKRTPNEDVQQVFRISFDGLRDNEKNIFLDIACFFKGEDKDHVSKILDSCDFSASIGISILEEKALISISKSNRLCMHDLIQEMGWEIVRQDSTKDPSKRSRLWFNEDIKDVLTRNRGTGTIEGIVLDLSAPQDVLDFNVDVFTNMVYLRVLKFRVGYNLLSAPCKMHLRGDFKFISENLRYLDWEGYPLKSLPSDFDPRKLFELKLRYSQLEQLWEGNKPFLNLTYMNLSESTNLIRTPDLSGAPELRSIDLEGCTSLVEVHPSIETLEKLSSLNLNFCSKLEELAKSFRRLTSLESVDLYDCSELKKLPDDLRVSSRSLYLCHCKKLEELPKSIGELTSLRALDLTDCSGLKKLPDFIGSLRLLETLVADGSGIQEIPPSISVLTRLKVLSLGGCKGGESCSSSNNNLALSSSSSLPRQGLLLPSLLGLRLLRELKLSDCNLEEGALPSDMSSLCSLRYLDLSGNSFITLSSLSPLSLLIWLKLESCTRLRSLTELPPSISRILASNCESLETFSHSPESYAKAGSETLLFDFCNCGRLVENEEGGSLAALLLGIRVVPPPSFSYVIREYALVPGSKIPEWFLHQSEGINSIIVQLPAKFCAFASVGFAFCTVLGENLPRWHSDQLWFGYQSAHMTSPKMLSRSVSHLKFSFVGYNGKEPLVVKEFGIRLLYDSDVDYDTDEESDTEEIIEYGSEEESDIEEEIIEYGSEEESDTELIIERETINTTVFSPPPAFDEKRCFERTIEAEFPTEIYCEPPMEDDPEYKYYCCCGTRRKQECGAIVHTLRLHVKVEGYDINLCS